MWSACVGRVVSVFSEHDLVNSKVQKQPVFATDKFMQLGQVGAIVIFMINIRRLGHSIICFKNYLT